jgi:hypothetical protein
MDVAVVAAHGPDVTQIELEGHSFLDFGVDLPLGWVDLRRITFTGGGCVLALESGDPWVDVQNCHFRNNYCGATAGWSGFLDMDSCEFSGN